ncbi:DUF935 family protein [Rhizobium sp. CRIBSB]|nr:DUF935 family protein [Rhizobium sp. CRIBSB]
MAGSLSSLVDHLGRPIDLGRLKAEHSAPVQAGVRSIVSGHPAQGLTPQRLTTLLRESETGNPLRYLELAEEMEEKDLHYLGVLGARKRAVAQLEITVEAGSDDAADQKAADMVRDWLKRDELESELFDILDAVGKGFSRTEILWDMSAREWAPVRLEWRDPRWFTFDPVDGRTPLLVDGGASGHLYGEPLPPFKYICHDHKAKSGLPIRGGLARASAWAYLFKNFVLKDWVAFAEIFGMPVRIGKYAPGETEENIRRLASAVADLGADAAAVVPQSMMIDFVKGSDGAGSADLYMKLCDYLDKQVSKATLGQTATTDAAPGAGLSGSGSEHGDVRQDIKKADAKQLAATINRDLIAPMARLNIPGLGRPPRISIGEAESWDVARMMPAVEKFVGMGGRVGMSAIRDKLGIEDPGEDEELLTPPSSAPPQNLAQEPPGPGGARSIPAKGPQSGPRPLLEPLKRPMNAEAAAAAAARAADSQDDALDRLTEAAIGDDWEALAEGLTGPIEALARDAVSLEALRAGLVERLTAMDTRQLVERLARAAFSARLAGMTGTPITEEEAGT